MSDSPFASAKGTRASIWAFRLVGTGIVLAILGLLGARVGLNPMFAMLLISLGSLSLIIAAITGVVALIRSGGSGGDAPAWKPWSAVALGAAAIFNAGTMMGGGGAPIHDISTDTVDPPEFVEVALLRGPNDNPAAYAGEETAALQASAYPDIETIVVLSDPAAAFATALAAAEKMGWEIVAADGAAGRIEATDTTPFVGFKDDVVIRVRGRGTETEVDVRSKSRVGKGDMGVNAKRIRAYREQLLAELDS